MKAPIRLSLILLVCIAANPAYACRFWAGVGPNASQSAVDQLIEQPRSLKALGTEYQDGWSVGYYKGDEPVVWRGALASNVDAKFDQAAIDASKESVDLVFAHLRRASSGCVDGVPNPHPFQMVKDGKTWLFGHNGGMKKQLLIGLIGEEYLDKNPPVICTEEAPDSWIDSELYFIYLMKAIEESDWDVEAGLTKGLRGLYQQLPEENRYLNFFLTDGQAVWAFRKGTSLYYLDDKERGQSYISSTVPSSDLGDWKEFPEDNLAILEPKSHIKFISLESHVSAH